MKKSLISGILSICMLISLSSFAFAEDQQNEMQNDPGSAEAVVTVTVSVESGSPEANPNGDGNNPTNTVEQSVSESASDIPANSLSVDLIAEADSPEDLTGNIGKIPLENQESSNHIPLEDSSEEVFYPEIESETEDTLSLAKVNEVVSGTVTSEENRNDFSDCAYPSVQNKVDENNPANATEQSLVESVSIVSGGNPTDNPITEAESAILFTDSPSEPNNDDNESPSSDQISKQNYLLVSLSSVPSENSNAHLSVSSSTTSTPVNSETYQIGETIEYAVTITNDGNVSLANVVVTDSVTGDVLGVIEELKPGEPAIVIASHTVTERDVINAIDDKTGKYTETVNVKAEAPEGVKAPEIAPASRSDDLRTDYTITVNYVLRDRANDLAETILKVNPNVAICKFWERLTLDEVKENGNPEMDGLEYKGVTKNDILRVPMTAGGVQEFRMGAGDNVLNVYYEEYEVRVHFVASDTGEALADDNVAYYRSGDSVSPVAAKHPSISGYEPQIPYVYLEGGMPADDISVTIFYDKEIPEIIVPGGSQESSNVITDYYPDYSNPVSAKEEDRPSEIAADGVSILVPIVSNQTVNTEDLHTILVELDGSKVSANDYTASVDESGELIVIFSADFIKTLSKGTHTIAVKIMNEIHYITLTID